MKQPPRLLESTLTGQVYVVTRYTVKETHLLAHTKYDVTEDFERIVANRAADLNSAKPTRQAWKNDGHTWECKYNPFADRPCTCDRPGLKAVGKDWPDRTLANHDE